jgi:pyruvate formate lyase activating enzyme
VATAFDLRGLVVDSLLEWEGRVSVVAVAGGCNWRCPFCHGWRYVTGLADLPRLSVSALWALLDDPEARGWRDGVVVSGGEPTLQPGLAELCRGVKARGLAVKLHTNGSRPDALEALLAEGLLDCVALDFKAPLDGRLARAAATAMPEERLEEVRRAFRLAAASGLEREYHSTLCPAVVDEAALMDMAGSLAELERGRARPGRWCWQAYRSADALDPAAAGDAAFAPEETARMAARARAVYPNVKD